MVRLKSFCSSILFVFSLSFLPPTTQQQEQQQSPPVGFVFQQTSVSNSRLCSSLGRQKETIAKYPNERIWSVTCRQVARGAPLYKREKTKSGGESKQDFFAVVRNDFFQFSFESATLRYITIFFLGLTSDDIAEFASFFFVLVLWFRVLFEFEFWSGRENMRKFNNGAISEILSFIWVSAYQFLKHPEKEIAPLIDSTFIGNLLVVGGIATTYFFFKEYSTEETHDYDDEGEDDEEEDDEEEDDENGTDPTSSRFMKMWDEEFKSQQDKS